ncbi:hypothetical protein [Streptomyces piniterrae]|uniref:hypothetical protein n=1 Tax=Streptomyces piniterrae TaxID=2571125 RepID=UPI00145D99E3|nr:hypothetical protein [Streptomyces piniterrae]
MTTQSAVNTWTGWTSGTVVRLPEVPEGATLAEAKGESRKVYEIDGRPGWLAKLYRQPLTAPEEDRLEALIALPSGMPETDVALLDRQTAWPVARIVDAGRTVGVVMARAPGKFFATIRKRFSGDSSGPEPLPLDWLIATNESIAKRGLRAPDAATRTRAGWELLRIGALFERHHVVYADWSYSNAFWDQDTGEVFVIDMDTCGIHRREWIESPGGEDPLFQDNSRPLTAYSDRYKVALLAVRCLTGHRDDPHAAYGRLDPSVRESGFGTELHRMLTATDPTDRPGLGELLTAFEVCHVPQRRRAADGSNVTGEVRVRGRASRGGGRVDEPREDAPGVEEPRGGERDDGGGAASAPPGAANVTGWVPLRGRARRSSGTPPAAGARPQEPIGDQPRETAPPRPDPRARPRPAPAPPPDWPPVSVTRPRAPARRWRLRRVAAPVAAGLVAAYLIAHHLLGWV